MRAGEQVCRTAPLSEWVGKYTVNAFVEVRIGGDYLIPLIGINDRFEALEFDALPQRFAVKATHGCGRNILDRESICTCFNDDVSAFLALRNIEKYEESTYFYPSIKGEMVRPFKCLCRSKNCIGTFPGPAVLKQWPGSIMNSAHSSGKCFARDLGEQSCGPCLSVCIPLHNPFYKKM